MARPTTSVKLEHATEQALNEFLLTATAQGRRCLGALLAVHKGESKLQAAQTAKVSLRTLQRWLKLFNTRGLEGLAALSRAGRQSKINVPELDSRLFALVSSSRFLSIAKVRKQLAQTHQIHLSYTTLRRYLKLLGYLTKKGNSSDQTSIGPELPSPEKEWTDAWPDVYGESLADYLAGRRSRTKTAGGHSPQGPLRGAHPFSS